MLARDPVFTPQDKQFLLIIRDDIIARPDLYRDGIDHLARHFSSEALHAADVKTWLEERDVSTRIAANREIAAHFAWLATWPDDEQDERDRIEREMYSHAASMPSKEKWSYLSNRLTEASVQLLREGIETSDDDLNLYDMERAKAVLCLTWLLTDKDADTHSLGECFGPWLAGQRGYVKLPRDEEFSLEVAAQGRAMARVATLDASDPELRTRWMDLAKSAWDALQKESAVKGLETEMSKDQVVATGAAKASRGRFYVYCRFWPGFTDRFPFDTFNHLPDDKIVGAAERAVEQQFRAHPDLAAKWQSALEDEVKARWSVQMKYYRPVSYGGANVTGPRHPKHGQPIHPKPQVEPIPPLSTAPGMQYALWVLGWRGAPDQEWRIATIERRPPFCPLVTPASHPYQTRHLIVSAELEQDAADAVKVLQRQYGNVPRPARFGYFGGDGMDRVGRLVCDQQVDHVRDAVAAGLDSSVPTNARGSVHSASAPGLNHQQVCIEVVQYARCALDLLARMAAARRGHVHSEQPTPRLAVERPKVLAGKEGRRKYVEERYKQLADERDSAGKPVYCSQEKIIEKLVKEDVASRNTILSDIKILRGQGLLPSQLSVPSRRKPKEVTNRMHHINPTRRDAK